MIKKILTLTISNIIIVFLMIGSDLFGQLENNQSISKERYNCHFQFLKISTGGRGTSMGGRMLPFCSDLTSSYWNPAGIAKLQGVQVYFENYDWLAGTDYHFGSFGFSWSGVGVMSLSMTMLLLLMIWLEP